MGESALQVGVHDDTIIVTDPATRYYAIYTKPLDRAELLAHGPQHLTLLRRRPTKDRALLAAAYQAADAKARELGWIV
jgi:hypothetical protein